MTTPRHHEFSGGATARYSLLGAVLFLTAIGLVMIYSASSITALDQSWNHLVRQMVFIAIGTAFAAVLERLDYRSLRGKSNFIWWGCMALLLVVLGIGYESHGAQRWIPLGLFNLQPSELAKVACVFAVSAVAVDWQARKVTGKEFGWRVFMLTIVPAFLIMLQPDMGTTATLIVAVVMVLLLVGIPFRWVAGATGILGLLGIVFVRSSEYRWARVVGFMNPWEDPGGKGYQTIQALYAFGSGGVDGVGLGLSRQKFFYLPEAHTDFILAVLGEEAGLLGTVAVVVAFCVFVWAGMRIAAGARDRFGRLVAGGITGMIAFQALVNMAAVTGLMPVTGKPLPFVSYGGSSMIVTMIALGLLLSVSRYGALAPRAVRPRTQNKEHRFESGDQRRRDGRAHISGADRGRKVRRRA